MPAADGSLPNKVRVDGGMVANNWLMQFLSDVLDLPIDRPKVTETTALGAAFLAGLKAGMYANLDEVRGTWQVERHFSPQMESGARKRNIDGWKDAVSRVLR